MDTNHAIFTSDYLLGVESVLRAGRRLQGAINEDRMTVEYAATRLERAAEQHGAGAAGYRAFMFSELETTAESDLSRRERTTEDTLASIVTDLQVGNVLVAAGEALGETGEKADPDVLDDALTELETTVPAVNRALTGPIAAGTEPGRFGFAKDAATAKVTRSPDLPSAIEDFGRRVDEVLDALVDETQSVATGIISALSKLGGDKVLAAFSALGDQMREMPRMPRLGRLFGRGIAKLEEGIDALIRLLGRPALARVKDQIEKLWQGVKEGEPLALILEWSFGVKTTRTRIGEILDSEGLQREALDEANNALQRLTSSFKDNMALARGLTSTLALASVLLAFTPLAGPNLVLLIASANVLILSAVVLIGMDYADSGRILKRVRGVCEISESVLPG